MNKPALYVVLVASAMLSIPMASATPTPAIQACADLIQDEYTLQAAEECVASVAAVLNIGAGIDQIFTGNGWIDCVYDTLLDYYVGLYSVNMIYAPWYDLGSGKEYVLGGDVNYPVHRTGSGPCPT